MATGPGVNQGKTKFLEEFLPGNRDVDVGDVNRAWAAAGHEGSISESLYGKIRSRLNLTTRRGPGGGREGGGAGPKAKGKPKASPEGAGKGPRAEEAKPQPANGEARGGGGPNKSAFLRDLFGRNPALKESEANEAWQRAGLEGKIASSLFYNVRKAFGGEAGPGSASGGPGSPESQRTREAVSESNEETAPSTGAAVAGLSSGDRERVLDRVEDRIDDLFGELEQLGGLEDALEALRKARRVVVRSHEG